ncbi:MAG: hypothetical protein Kow0081_3830 [Candidatus Dojkabacteria bacterium]
MKREPRTPGEFRSNISQGGIGYLAELPLEYLVIARNAARCFQTEIAGVDLIVDQKDNSIKILEVNQAPQFQGIEKYTGVNVIEKFLEYIQSKV